MAESSPPIGGSPAADTDFTDQALAFLGRNARLIAPLITLTAMVVFFSLASDVFLTVRNFQNVVTQVSPIAVAAAGTTYVLLCAEIDLSIAAVSTFTGIVTAYIFAEDWLGLGSWGIIVAALGALLIGLINGVLIAYVGIPSFMMTLAMISIASGLGVYITEGRPINNVPPSLKELASVSNKFLGIPKIGIFAAIVLLIAHILLAYTRFGRYVYMTGGNREAAELSGVNTKKILVVTMMISALTAGMCGMLFIGRLNSANPAAGTNVLIDTIAAVVLGGTSLFGGEGGIPNTVIGLLIFAVLSNGLNLLPDLSIYFKEALQGIILLAALLLNVLALRLETVNRRTG